MALSADDRLLGEKTHYYCSSSEDEADSADSGASEDETPAAASCEQPAAVNLEKYSGTCVNTGPKGVLQDYRRFKQLESEQREENVLEREQLAKKLAMTCKTSEEEDADRELAELLGEVEDEFLLQYREQRIQELNRLVHENNPTFGKVYRISREEFVQAVDSEKPRVTVIVHLFEESVPACRAMSGCLQCLASNYPRVKFCEMRASDANMSHKFTSEGVPTLLVYRNKELVGSHLRLADQLGDDFFANEVEALLLEHGQLPSNEPLPSALRGPPVPEDDTSDFELD